MKYISFITLLFLTSCTVSPSTNYVAESQKLNIGSHKEDIINVLGKPDRIVFRKKDEMITRLDNYNGKISKKLREKVDTLDNNEKYELWSYKSDPYIKQKLAEIAIYSPVAIMNGVAMYFGNKTLDMKSDWVKKKTSSALIILDSKGKLVYIETD